MNRAKLSRTKHKRVSRTIRVLAIDGGGIRGIIPATVLVKIENITQLPIAHLFDIVVGTSTGTNASITRQT
jgi:patatin-like phospholipase/acyl hydrolase